MRPHRRALGALAALALGMAAGGCGAATPLTDVTSEPLPDDAQRIEQANLLVSPVADAEGLLGREVHTTEDGHWTIADSRRSRSPRLIPRLGPCRRRSGVSISGGTFGRNARASGS